MFSFVHSVTVHSVTLVFVTEWTNTLHVMVCGVCGVQMAGIKSLLLENVDVLMHLCIEYPIMTKTKKTGHAKSRADIQRAYRQRLKKRSGSSAGERTATLAYSTTAEES